MHDRAANFGQTAHRSKRGRDSENVLYRSRVINEIVSCSYFLSEIQIVKISHHIGPFVSRNVQATYIFEPNAPKKALVIMKFANFLTLTARKNDSVAKQSMEIRISKIQRRNAECKHSVAVSEQTRHLGQHQRVIEHHPHDKSTLS